MGATSMNQGLYRRLDVWVRQSATTSLCYRLFQRLSDSRYAVQNRDSFSLPVHPDDLLYGESNTIELFTETDIEEREKFYLTIEEAVQAFDEDFS